MASADLIVQRPAAPKQLLLLFHGVGSSARDLEPLGEALAPHLPDAAIVSVQSPESVGRGRQWFSVLVLPVRRAVDAVAQLQAAGAASTLDRFPGPGHGIDRRVVDTVVRRLRLQDIRG